MDDDSLAWKAVEHSNSFSDASDYEPDKKRMKDGFEFLSSEFWPSETTTTNVSASESTTTNVSDRFYSTNVNIDIMMSLQKDICHY